MLTTRDRKHFTMACVFAILLRQRWRRSRSDRHLRRILWHAHTRKLFQLFFADAQRFGASRVQQTSGGSQPQLCGEMTQLRVTCNVPDNSTWSRDTTRMRQPYYDTTPRAAVFYFMNRHMSFTPWMGLTHFPNSNSMSRLMSACTSIYDNHG